MGAGHGVVIRSSVKHVALDEGTPNSFARGRFVFGRIFGSAACGKYVSVVLFLFGAVFGTGMG